jgi:DNA-binding NarL/FixJ family response regulator
MANHPVEPKRRVFLVDDHALVREWLGSLIRQQRGLTTCGEADNARDALQGIASTQPDVAIVDLTLKDSSGLDLIKELNHSYPNVAVLVLTMHDETLYAERALRNGAQGYIMKREATQKVIEAIYRILGGKIYVSDQMNEFMSSRYLEGMASAVPGIQDLSDREWEVFQLLGQGDGITTIAETLHISAKTVHAHCARMRAKLHLQSSRELLLEAIRRFQVGSMR